ncbi:MAG TPA: hypothetical protein PLQ93_05925 [Bacteroidia bacterium]|nr:hypothetical protein [Bacteroidia bacterium]
MKTQDKLYNQHNENKEWTSKLKFYKEELEILKKRLAEIAARNNQSDVLKEVEHFQNQFIVQRNNIDEIAHAVNLNEEALIDEVKKNPVAVDRRKVNDHAHERDLVESLEKSLNDIRSEFNRFAAKWL